MSASRCPRSNWSQVVTPAGLDRLQTWGHLRIRETKIIDPWSSSCLRISDTTNIQTRVCQSWKSPVMHICLLSQRANMWKTCWQRGRRTTAIALTAFSSWWMLKRIKIWRTMKKMIMKSSRRRSWKSKTFVWAKARRFWVHRFLTILRTWRTCRTPSAECQSLRLTAQLDSAYQAQRTLCQSSPENERATFPSVLSSRRNQNNWICKPHRTFSMPIMKT